MRFRIVHVYKKQYNDLNSWFSLKTHTHTIHYSIFSNTDLEIHHPLFPYSLDLANKDVL